VNVFDATATPLPGAEVRFINNETSPAIDTIRYTDLSGVAYLSGAPAASNYQIIATDTGYSTDRTYVATTSNPNPATPPVAVLESQVSTMNFQIDQLSDIRLTVASAATYDTFFDTFADYSLIVANSNTSITTGAFQLTDTAGTYDTSGSIQSTSTVPSLLDSWYSVAFNASTSAQAWVQVSVMYDNAGVLTLVPDEDLPGNSSGFQSTPIDITGLDVTSYPELALYGLFRTTDASQTPLLYDWDLTHVTSQSPISGAAVSIKGAKSIGADNDAQPILKYEDSGVSDSSGAVDFDAIEWDIYTIAVTSPEYSVHEACPASPYALSPGVTQEMKLTLGAASPQLLHVIVNQVDGTPVPGATVRLENTGVDQSRTTSLCGQSYFDTGLYNDTEYVLTVTAAGFTTEVTSNTAISGTSVVTVILN